MELFKPGKENTYATSQNNNDLLSYIMKTIYISNFAQPYYTAP